MPFEGGFQMIADNEQDNHENQQTGRNDPHLPQFGVTLRITRLFRLPKFIDRFHRRCISRGVADLPSRCEG